MRYLLDTNILSDLVRNPQGRITREITRVGEHVIATSVVAAAELRFGAAKSGSVRLIEAVDLVLSAIEVLPLSVPCDSHYAAIRRKLELQDTPIGPDDLFIAAQARTLGLTVVTTNVREFERVEDLRVENWLG